MPQVTKHPVYKVKYLESNDSNVENGSGELTPVKISFDRNRARSNLVDRELALCEERKWSRQSVKGERNTSPTRYVDIRKGGRRNVCQSIEVIRGIKYAEQIVGQFHR